MKAIILAAGLGTRLYPITNEVPKCMVPVNGIRIIDKQVHNLLSKGVKDIFVVAGYKSDVLVNHLREIYPTVHIIENKRFFETNNMYSLYMAMPCVYGEDFLLMNADVYYDASIVEDLLNSSEPSMVACDKSQYIEESMKITIDAEGRITHIGKKIKEEEAYAVSIDVYKISKESSKILFENVKQTIEVKKDENSWSEVALNDIFSRTTFKPYVIKGRWFEIDNHDDLATAERIFNGDVI